MTRCIIDKKTGKVAPWTALQLAAYTLLSPNDGLIFDEASHTYTLSGFGVALPSVTGILKAEGFIDGRFYDEYSRDRGSLVHLATHYDDMGELDEVSLDPVIVPYVEAWRKFKRESGFVVEESEIPMVSLTHGYAGKPDTIGHFPKGTLKRAAVELHPDGTYKLYPYEDRNDLAMWLAVVAVHNWKRNYLRGGK